MEVEKRGGEKEKENNGNVQRIKGEMRRRRGEGGENNCSRAWWCVVEKCREMKNIVV